MTPSFDLNPDTRVLCVRGKSITLRENPAKLLQQLLLRGSEPVRKTVLVGALGIKLSELEDVFEDLQAQLVEVDVSKWLQRKGGVYSFAPIIEQNLTIYDVIASLAHLNEVEKVVALAQQHYTVEQIAEALGLRSDVVRQLVNGHRQGLDTARAAKVARGKYRMFHQ